MALILDTNALSAFAEGLPAIRPVLERSPDLALPSVVLGEYLFGVRQSRARAQYEAWLRLPTTICGLQPWLANMEWPWSVAITTLKRYLA